METNYSEAKIKSHVESWLDEVVIGLKLCPFAKQPRHQNQIHIQVSDAKSIEALMICLVEECTRLEQTPCEKLETTLIVVANLLESFDDYLDCLFLAEQIIETQSWQGIFQIASFHPHYQFEGTTADDKENLTNRSPYPVFHILRENSLTSVIRAYGDTSKIPECNKDTLNNLTQEELDELFKFNDF